MKYKIGDIVLLYDGRTAYVSSVEKKSKTYHVCDMDDNGGNVFAVKDSDIYSLVMSA